MGMSEWILSELRDQVPGAAVAVIRHGEPVAEVHTGAATLEWPSPVGGETVFRLASITKALTGLAAASMARDGAVELGAPIREYLPELPVRLSGLTVHQLLTHTSGLTNFLSHGDFYVAGSRRSFTEEELLARFGTLPCDFRPGDRFAYSNTGYVLLGMALARVAGSSLHQVLTDRVFAPAGMVASGIFADEEIVPRAAGGYAWSETGFAHAGFLSMSCIGGAGGGSSTVDDMVRLDRAVRSGVFGEGVWEQVTTPLRLTSGRTENYGYGVGVGTYRGRRFVKSVGGINGFSTLWATMPDDELSVVVLTNREGFPCGRLARRIVDRMLDLPVPRHDRIPADARAHANRAGMYTIANPPGRFDVEVDGDRLVLRDGTTTYRMSAVDGVSRYAADDDPDVTATFTDAEGACTVTYPMNEYTRYR